LEEGWVAETEEDVEGDEWEVDWELVDAAVRFLRWGGTYAPGIFAIASE
jgi:hypothetical protein